MRASMLVAVSAVVALAGCTGESGFEQYGCPDVLTVDADVLLGNAFGAARLGDAAMHSIAIPLSNGTDALPWICFDQVRVTIAWTNTPDAGGDLYVGYDAGETIIGHDEQQLALDGPHEEHVVGPTPSDGDAVELTVHLYSDWAVLSASGLPVKVTIELT